MHPLHIYVAKQLAEKLKSRTVIVWYDNRSEFAPFIKELRGSDRISNKPVKVSVGGATTQLVEYAGSMLELRMAIEPHVSGDLPQNVLIYLPGCERDQRGSMLMELEKGGECYETSLKRLARNILRHRFTDGIIDDILAPERVSYEDLVHALADDKTGTPSILKAIYRHHVSSEDLLADWLGDEDQDSEIKTKEAQPELEKLFAARLGFVPPTGCSLNKLRLIAQRYVLANEFRSDLRCPAPAVLDSVAQPPGTDEAQAVRNVAALLRVSYPESYASAAEQVEDDLKLASLNINPAHLGAIDTFRFEERALLQYTAQLIASRSYTEALEVVRQRDDSFWILREFTSRKAQWEACRRMAELGLAIQGVERQLTNSPVEQLVSAYTAADGWHLVDRAQRKLESWVAGLDDEPDEKALGIVRRAYDDLCARMATQFATALKNADWVVSGVLSQTHVHAEVLATQPSPVAYLMVDALRFEMGADLADRLPRAAEFSIRPAMAAIPGITPVGMAALLPGASSDFAVIDQQGKFGSRIDGSFLPDLATRRKFFSARSAGMVDISLDELLSLPPTKLSKKIGDAPLVVVRSQEIDHAGETGFTHQARQIMDTVIDNLVRAIRKLATAGIEHFVVSADHGHLFFPTDRDESLRTDGPSANSPMLHRRCWAGQGGSTPAGCIRVAAAKLGYDSELDFVFPPGIGVFKTGGDLAYYHGGISLQELVVPVLTVRLKVRESIRPKQSALKVSNAPQTITNRIISVILELTKTEMSLFETAMTVRPVLLSSGRQVGAVGMAVGAECDKSTGSVTLQQAKPATVALLLTEDVPSVRLAVLDPATDAELYRSPAEIPVKLM